MKVGQREVVLVGAREHRWSERPRKVIQGQLGHWAFS